MAETARTQKYTPIGLSGGAEASALLHLEQAEPLIPILFPDSEELLALLSRGHALSFLTREDAAEQSDALLTGLEREPLQQALETLAVTSGRAARLQGWSGLCLAEGRLTGPEQISAPLLLWPVSLTETEDGSWALTRGSEGGVLNTAVLGLLPAPAEGWSPNRDPLARQLDTCLTEQPEWARKEGLWLGRFPLWACELPGALERPLPDGSAARLLEQAPGEPPRPDVHSTDGEEGLLAPLPMDGVQMTALNRLMQGETLLVSGGRGSGKTRLAVGLMANALGIGQRVLLVAPREPDRAAALAQMAEMGLQDLVLELPGGGDRKRAVLRQYNLAEQVHPHTSVEGYFSLSEQTAQLSRRLDRYVSALHTPGKCGLSPFALICRSLESEISEDALLPLSQPMLSHLDAQGLENRLSCARALVRSAKALGAVWEHPLAMVRGSEFPAEAREQLPELLDTLLAELDQLAAAGETWCTLTGLEPPRTQEDWNSLQEGAKLLREWQNYPAGWASSPRIPLLLETVQELRRHFDRMQQLQNRIQADWEDPVFTLDAVKLEKQWHFLQEGWTLPSEPERERTLRQLLAEAESLLSGLELVGRQWSRSVGIAAPTTRDSWERSYEVAVELARWKEIPGEWGSCDSLQALLWDVGELIDHGKQAKECKEVLLRDWIPEFLQLNAQELSERWQRENGSWGFGWIRRQSALRAELERYCRGKLTANLLEDSLRWLLDYQTELSDCDEIYHRWERELKSVYQREDTVWLWLEAARSVAAESHDWLTELTGSEDFLRQYGNSEDAIAAAEQLQTQWEQARDTLGRLDVMIGRTGQPDSRNWLAERRSDCRRLRNLLQIRKLLEKNAKAALTLGQIGDALHLFAQHQTEQTAVSAICTRWAPELEGLYLGSDTDWDSLLTRSIQAVNSDDALAERTGDLELRARLAGDVQAQAAAQALCSSYQAVCAQGLRLTRLLNAQLTAGALPWLDELRESCKALRAHLDELERWMLWRGQCRQGESLGLNSFVSHFDRPIPPEEDTLALFTGSLYRALLQLELDWIPELKQFSGRQFGEVLRQYARLDRQLSRRTWEELLHLASSRLPDLVREPLLQEEVSLLRWANETAAQDISLEGLIHGLPRLTRDFFPCVLASPADALRCFGEKEPFDYVVIDGAEQLPAPVGRALLGLGKTALLLSGGRESCFPCLTDAPSLWTVCQPLPLPRLTLRRCYLSRPESLHWLQHLTDGSTSVPSSHPRRFAVRCQPVVGCLTEDGNPAEAAAAAARAVELVENGATDLAVAALTDRQARLIRALLRQAAQDNPALAEALLALPVLPVWALGSRRWATLIFSLTLAPDEPEGLQNACALVRRWDGVSPLTNALAAARQQLWLFFSLDRQDWPTLAALRPQLTAFLQFAQAGEISEPVQPLPVRSRIQAELCTALRERGVLAEPAPAPLAIRIASPQPGSGYLLGVLLDDGEYGAIPRTRERELTCSELLQAQGWNLCRVWTMDWLLDQERVLTLLEKMLEQLQAPAEPESASKPDTAQPQQPETYALAELKVIAIRDNEVRSPSFQNRIYRVVEQIILQEAPLSLPQLTCRMLTAFGLDAQDPELQAHCDRLWHKLGLRITREDALEYVWRTDQDPDRYRQYRVRGAGPALRRPEDISCQESVNAACVVLSRETALPAGELAELTAQALGYDPADEAAAACGQRGIAYGLTMGRLLDTPIGTIVRNAQAR